jgi:hypothetical protein
MGWTSSAVADRLLRKTVLIEPMKQHKRKLLDFLTLCLFLQEMMGEVLLLKLNGLQSAINGKKYRKL